MKTTTSPLLQAAHTWVRRRIATKVVTQETGMHQRYILTTFARQMGNRQPENIGRADIERWLATLGNLAPGSRRRYYTVVRSFFDDLVDAETIRRNPVRRCPRPVEPRTMHRAFTPTQAGAIVAACPGPFAVCYILLALQCGLRRAELAGIELGDIDWTGDPLPTLFVVGKGGHERVVSIPLEAQRAIRAYLEVRPAGRGPLLRHPLRTSEGVSARFLGEDFTRIAYAAGVKQHPSDGISLHACRHTAATDIYRECLDMTMVRDILGHASTATTDRYVAGVAQRDLAVAMEGRSYGVGAPALHAEPHAA